MVYSSGWYVASSLSHTTFFIGSGNEASIIASSLQVDSTFSTSANHTARSKLLADLSALFHMFDGIDFNQPAVHCNNIMSYCRAFQGGADFSIRF